MRECYFGQAANDGNGGTQFVRGIGHKTTLLRESPLQARDHLVEDQSQILHFIFSKGNGHALMKVGGANLAGCLSKAANRKEGSAREPVAAPGAHSQNKWRDDEQAEQDTIEGG